MGVYFAEEYRQFEKEMLERKKEYLEKGTMRKPRPEKSDDMGAEYQQVGMISDLILSAEAMAKYKREHWKCSS